MFALYMGKYTSDDTTVVKNAWGGNTFVSFLKLTSLFQTQNMGSNEIRTN